MLDDHDRTQEKGPCCHGRAAETCLAFRQLKAWQVAQYRKAVDENKWYLSERNGYEVSWAAAERDFMEHGIFIEVTEYSIFFHAQFFSIFHSNGGLRDLFQPAI